MLQLLVSCSFLVWWQLGRKASWRSEWYHCVIMWPMPVVPNAYGPSACLRAPLTFAPSA